jgi:hypothetical protein
MLPNSENILESPIWQFVGVVVAILAIVLTIYLYRRQNKRKRFAYQIVASTPLVSVQEGFQDKLEIVFNGQTIKDAQLLLIKLINSGDMPILADDFKRKVTVTFGEGSKVLTAEVTDAKPKSIRASLINSDTQISLNSLLLNERLMGALWG